MFYNSFLSEPLLEHRPYFAALQNTFAASLPDRIMSWTLPIRRLRQAEHDLEPLRKNMRLISNQGIKPMVCARTFASRVWSRAVVSTMLLASLLLTSCAPGANLSPLPTDETGTAYHLGTGDQVRVITFGGDQLTGEFRINDSGNIAIPLLGSVHAAGLTTAQLGDTIATDLQKKELLKNPSVSVEVIAYRPFFVLGEVTKPGEYPYEPGMTVLTAASIAGGFTYRAFTDYASITRTTPGGAVEGRVTRQTLVKPGDVITIFERRF
jgi:polysaccharide export outer membrane protein